MSWSPFKPEVMADPANGYADLLDACPVHRCAEFDPPFYTLSRYADVEAALRDIDTFSSEFGQGPRFTPPVGMLSNPPDHTFYRALVQPAFTPRRMEALRPRIEGLVDELIDHMEGECDLHDDFAFPLPVVIIAELLGVPVADLERFKRWSDISVTAMGAEDPTEYASDMMEFQKYLANHMRARRAQVEAGAAVPDDLLTMVAGHRDQHGKFLPNDQVLSVLNQLLVGGNETTTSLITNCLWRLLEQPTLWQQLVEDPTLAEAALEESLRFDPPVLGLYRNTTRAVEVAGATIPEGVKVLLHYGAANRDATVFEDPDVFSLTRDRQRHMSFGLGVHFCLGAPMARLEARIALEKLAERLPNLSLRDSGERIAPFFLWGRRRLPTHTGRAR